MNLKSYLIILITTLLLSEIPVFLCQNQQYQTCTQPFHCANIRNISYPFFGGSRPSSCGYPGFELTCNSDTPLINITSLTYGVIEIHNSTQTLRVSRQDLLPCPIPPFLLNTTLDSRIFNYSSDANDRNITLFYGCPREILQVTNRYSCMVNGTDTSGIYVTQDSLIIPGFGTTYTCAGSIFIPVNEIAEGILSNPGATSSSPTNLLLDALESGFSIEWSANNSHCDNCVGSGGVCGYEQSTSSFACHCEDRTYNLTCGNQNGAGNGTNTQWRNIGLPIAGAVLAGFFLGWIIFFCRQKRKKKLIAKSSQVVSKEITPPSSNSPLTPSTVSTKSIPSLPSSKSDLFRQESAYFGVQVFSYDELEEATDSFNESKELGEGGFGRVYYGVLSDGRIVAVKRLYENNFKRVEQFMNEVEILTRLRHENLVLLYGCTSKRSRELLLVYEYIPNGTVACHLNGRRAKSGLLSWPVRLNIAIESASALAYLHKSDIIHRDVKTNNILLDNDFHVKVADFGLSRLFPNDVTHVSTAPQGTPGYVDPEYYQCYHLTEKSDVYSFGVVLIELISSLPAVDTNRHRHDINLANMAVNKIQIQALHELVDPTLGFETSSEVRRMTTLVAQLAFRCLQQERDMRPSMDEVLEALKGIQSEDLDVHRVEIVDISMDEDAALLKGSVDTDSEATEKWNSGSNPNSNV